MSFNDLTVIIPTFNEEKSISVLLKLLVDNYPNISVIVSDDGSTDKTREMVGKFKRKVYFLDRKNEPIKGLTISVIDGIKKCKTRFFLVMDGDLQHPWKKVSEIYAKLSSGNKLVIASRERVDEKWPISRKIISYGATFLGRLKLLPKNYFSFDIMTGFFGMETKLATKVISKNKSVFIPEGYKILFDFLKVLPKNNVVSVSYVFGSRKYGHSKLASKHFYFFIKSLIK